MERDSSLSLNEIHLRRATVFSFDIRVLDLPLFCIPSLLLAWMQELQPPSEVPLLHPTYQQQNSPAEYTRPQQVTPPSVEHESAQAGRPAKNNASSTAKPKR